MKWNVKTLGRMAEDGEGTLWLAAPGSEISFQVTGGRRLEMNLKWDGAVPESTPERIWPRYAIYLDGTKIMDARLNLAERRMTVFEDPTAGEHTIRLVKLSECSHSLIGISDIQTDGTMRPMPEKKLKIEFIGDSITCGYGVEGTEKDTFSTETENAEKSHAFLAGRALEADTAMTAYSGCGLISGWTDGERNDGNLMTPIYEKAGRMNWTLPGGKRLQDMKWNFSAWQPDYIVIDLGNNDQSWTREMPERKALYQEKYREFLSMVRRNNPGARILCALGVEGPALVAEMKEAAAQWQAETGDTALRTLELAKMDPEQDGAGADMHPSERTQKKLGRQVEQALREWMETDRA